MLKFLLVILLSVTSLAIAAVSPNYPASSGQNPNSLTNPTVSGVLSIPAGTGGAPSITFGGVTTTGFYSPGAGSIYTNSAFSVANIFTAVSVGSAYNGKVLTSFVAPTITGFGTGPTFVHNGSGAITITVGTGGTAASGVIALPAASTGWNCQASPAAAPQAGAVMYVASTSTTTATVTNYTQATGVALAWPASAVINVNCLGR